MANPNILNSTSVKYFNYTQILETQRYTVSTSLTSDYQTKNIVLRNDVNSGKILKITRMYFSNQSVANRNGLSNTRSLYLTYIKDYTDATIADTTVAFNNVTYLPIYGDTRLDLIRGNIRLTVPNNNPRLDAVQILPQTTIVGINTTNLLYGADSFYLMEGNAFECWAYGGSTSDLVQAEFTNGRARIHIEYEEYTG